MFCRVMVVPDVFLAGILGRRLLDREGREEKEMRSFGECKMPLF